MNSLLFLYIKKQKIIIEMIFNLFILMDIYFKSGGLITIKICVLIYTNFSITYLYIGIPFKHKFIYLHRGLPISTDRTINYLHISIPYFT